MQFEIPKEWLDFCEFRQVSPDYRFYFYGHNRPDVEVIPLSEIEPPSRAIGVTPFKKFKMVPVLMALMNTDGELPPVVVSAMTPGAKYKYKLKDGFHRFYASALAGYIQIPVIVSP